MRVLPDRAALRRDRAPAARGDARARGGARPHDAPWAELPIALIDVETTGSDASVDRVVEVGHRARRAAGEIVERRNWLVNPGRPIPKEASDVHKITDDDVKDAPSFAAVADEIAAMLGGLRARRPTTRRSTARSSETRSPELRAGDAASPCVRRNVEWVDPLVWARELQQGERSRALGEVAARLGIALENAHRASDDAEAALKVLLALGRDVRVPPTYAALVQEQRRLAMAQADERRLNGAWRLSDDAPIAHCARVAF